MNLRCQGPVFQILADIAQDLRHDVVGDGSAVNRPGLSGISVDGVWIYYPVQEVYLLQNQRSSHVYFSLIYSQSWLLVYVQSPDTEAAKSWTTTRAPHVGPRSLQLWCIPRETTVARLPQGVLRIRVGKAPQRGKENCSPLATGSQDYRDGHRWNLPDAFDACRIAGSSAPALLRQPLQEF